MSLRVWLPLNGNLKNQGLSDYQISIFRGTETYNNSGKIGKCFYANGTNTLKILNIIPDIYNYNSYSLCCWFYIEAQNTSHSGSGIISGGNWNNQLLNLSVSDWSTDHYTKLRISGTNWNRTYSYNFTLNTWYHAVVCDDGVKTYAYINGNLIGDSASSFLPTSIEGNDICIGGATYYSGMQFFGRINDVRIYDHCLSKKEVEEISKGLVLHYKLDNNGLGGENLLSRYVSPGQQAPGIKTTAGRTNYYGDYGIIIPAAENADTYFRLFLKEQLIQNEIYTISCNVSGLLNGSFYNFPLFAQNNTSMGVLSLDHNGLCSLTFTMTYSTQAPVTINGETIYVCFMDDSARTIATNQGPITITNFKIEKGSTATSWSPNPTDLGLDTSIIYDSSGYQHNGDLIGTITNSALTPRYNVSTHFINGSYGRIQERPSICLPTDAITVNLWTRIDTWGNPISCTEGGGWNFENSSGIQFPVYVASVGYKVANSGVTPATLGNTWHMLTGTFDRENVKIYIDSVLKKTVATGSTNPIGYANNYLFLAAEASGNNTSPANSAFVGDLSDLRIYCTALTEDQIKELYDTSATIDKNGNVYAREVIE